MFFLLLLVTLSASKSFSQDNQLLDSIPTAKEDFAKTEMKVINTVDWLETDPINQETDKRKTLNRYLLGWISNSPTVNIDLDSKILTFTKKNAELILTFMGGWTKYSLQNSYSKDPVKCNLAGIKSVIKVYQMGNGIKKDKEVEKLIELDSKNELESWVTTQLSKK